MYVYVLKGGIKLSSDQSVFSFDLNETLYFGKGQEVAEIKGISLDPDISIQSFHDYISIRGVIKLNGEYEKDAQVPEEAEESLLDFEDFQAKRYVEKVVDLQDNEAEFTHRFPVEISVPAYRVNHLDDVTVSIEAFDYEFPDQSQLRLFSTIQIHGINSEEVPIRDLSEEEKKEPAQEEKFFDSETKSNSTEAKQATPSLADLETDRENTFTFQEQEASSTKNEEGHVSDRHVSEEAEPANNQHEEIPAEPDGTRKMNRSPEVLEGQQSEREIKDTFQFDVKKENDEAADSGGTQSAQANETKAEKTDPNRWPLKQNSQTLAEFFGNMPSTESIEDSSEEILEESSSSNTVDHSPDIHESSESRSESMEDVSYLADIFRDSEEDSYTKMRICIVQNEDTIETIAERFQVSPLQLIKQNQLEEDFDVAPGQLLYIPYKK